MRRAVVVTLSLGLLIIVGAVFTRVIAARVPEQRATLEKLITERTGLAVRFDNVHFAWGLDGTSAVFERVELTDPERGRVRVVAPELRVEFDTWDFLKHQQFSLGHVKLASPDIEIIGDPEPAPTAGAIAKRDPAPAGPAPSDEDEATALRRLIAWAELMPIGRVEVEGARVHLLRRGDRAPRHSFTLSQANLSRGTHNINAFGTLQLSQDIGQSLFVSARLDNLGSARGASGELRFIARRLRLDKLDAGLARGRGTLDATIALREGRVHEGRWQASAREFEFTGGARFDHFTVNGSLKRAKQDVLLEFNDLQVTRGARLERAPRLTARVNLIPGTTRVAGTSLAADRLPFMTAEFMAALLPPRSGERRHGLPAEWSPSGGELHAVRLDSSGSFQATVVDAEIFRAADRARIGRLAGRIAVQGEDMNLTFDPEQDVSLWMPGASVPRALRLEGELRLRGGEEFPRVTFTGTKLSSDAATLGVEGHWGIPDKVAQPLTIVMAEVDRSLLEDVFGLFASQETPSPLAELRQGRIVAGQLQLRPLVAEGVRRIDWPSSRGSLTLADIASEGERTPPLTEAAGRLEFARGATQLRLTSGRIEDLDIRQARIDWPRSGEPRLQAAVHGELQSPLMQRLFAGQGFERLTGAVALDLDARGESALRDPQQWRVTARIEDATLPFSADLPPVEKLQGTARYSEGVLRGFALEGEWLGGPVKLDSRRGASRGLLSAQMSGAAEAAAVLALLGREDASNLVSGRFAWSGELQKLEDGWRISLDTPLAGVESQLPVPFAKPRSRQLAVRAGLRLDAQGMREFELTAGRNSIQGRVANGVTTAAFELHGMSGEWSDGANRADSRMKLDRLELRDASWVLATAGAFLPLEGDLALSVDDLRHADRSLGPLRGEISREPEGLGYTVASSGAGAHEFSGRGRCEQDGCALEFQFETRRLADLLLVAELPDEWPKESLRASGELRWQTAAGLDLTRLMSGAFEFEARGRDSAHQLAANATLDDGQIQFVDLRGIGPAPDEVLRGTGRVNLLARRYDVAVDYEQVAIAAAAVPSPARAGLARAWSALRGTAARRGWTEAPPPRRVTWQGSWD